MSAPLAQRRVVHVVDNLAVGGAQQLIVTFVHEAGRRGLPVTVVSLGGDVGSSRLAGELRAAGAEVVGLRHRSPARRVLELAGLLRARRPVSVQTHLTLANTLGAAAGLLARTPVVATLHNTRVGGDWNSDRALRAEGVALRRLASTVVAVGPTVAEAQEYRLGGRRAVVVPNATTLPPASSLERRAQLRRSLGVVSGERVLLAVGRLVTQKGYDDLLSAFIAVRAARPEAVLVVVGEGELGPALQARAAEAGVEDRVRWLGSRGDVPDLLAAADLYISASLWEGLPMTLLEAMAAGLPAVATATGDITTVVTPGSGVLVPTGRPDLLADAAVALLEDPTRAAQVGAAARRRIEEEYTAATWVDRLVRVYAAAPARRG